jgi:hypothetical protein
LQISRVGNWIKFANKWISAPRRAALKKDGGKKFGSLTKPEQTDEG